jgi:drug/metabolite transporter (DMT)-like permease
MASLCDIENMSPLLKSHSRLFGYGACALAGCLWGTGFFFGKVALTEVSVNHMVLYRFLFACLSLIPMIWWHRADFAPHRIRFSAREWRFLLLASFLGIPLQFLLQFRGLSLTTVSHASLMVGTMPVTLAVGATLFAGEKLDGIGWLALIGSAVGATLIVLGGRHDIRSSTGPTLTGDLLVVLSLTVALGWVLLNKHLMKSQRPTAVTIYGLLCGTTMLTIVVFLLDGPPPIHGVSPKVWLALAASGALCTATTTFLWNWGIHQVPASRAGVFLNLEPALGSLLGVKLLGEKLGPLAGIGGALIVGAAILLTSCGRPDRSS